MLPYSNIKCLVFANPTPLASIDTMAFDIAAAMRRLGIGSRIMMCYGSLDFDIITRLLYDLTYHSGPAFVLDINGRFDLIMGSSNFNDEMNVPKFSFLTDNPSHLMPRIRLRPETWMYGMVSTEHLQYCNLFGLKEEKSVFFPHGGPAPLLEQRLSQDRDIGILFAGNIQEAPQFDEWVHTVFPNSPPLREAFLNSFEDFCLPEKNIFSVLISAIQDTGLQNEPEELAKIFRLIERYFINRERIRILSAIKENQVTVYGKVPASLEQNLPHHRFMGEQHFVNVMGAMGRSKISLNIVPSFRSGGHERMFYALAYGSLLITDKNAFLHEDEKINPFVNFFPENLESLDSLLTDWINNPKRLDNLRPDAVDQYYRRHSWEQRLIPVIEGLDKLYWSKLDFKK